MKKLLARDPLCSQMSYSEAHLKFNLCNGCTVNVNALNFGLMDFDYLYKKENGGGY